MQANLKVLIIYTVSMVVKIVGSIFVVISMHRKYHDICHAGTANDYGDGSIYYAIYMSFYILNAYAIAYLLYHYGLKQ